MNSLTTEERRTLLDAALLLFERSDLEDLTLDQLSRASGIPQLDIVRHYQSRDNILAAVLERELEVMAAAANAPKLRMPGETLEDELHLLEERFTVDSQPCAKWRADARRRSEFRP